MTSVKTGNLDALMRLQLNFILNKDNYSPKLGCMFGRVLLSSVNFLSIQAVNYYTPVMFGMVTK